MKPAKSICTMVLCLLPSCVTVSNTDPHPTTHKLLLRDLLSGPDTPDPHVQAPPKEGPQVEHPATQVTPAMALPVTSAVAPTTAAVVPTTPPLTTTGEVTHVVFVWLKNPGNAEARKALIEASRTLKDIPGVVNVHVGVALPFTRPIVDSSYDVGVVVTFTDAHAMQDYLVNPVHLKLVNEVLKPAADRYTVYDFTNQ